MKKLFVIVALIALVVAPALADTASKTGEPATPKAPTVTNPPDHPRADFEYNTGGYLDFIPETGGSSTGWGEYFCTTILNDAGCDLTLIELGFPCCGPMTDVFGWLVWTGVGGMMAPPYPYSTCDFTGAFTPVDPAPDTFPPTVYTYIDITGEGIVIPDGTYFSIGYDVTGTGGQTAFNGVDTYADYGGMWDPDQGWGRTAIMQVLGNCGTEPTPTQDSTWGTIKAIYQ